ncbi:unnamed protein product [Symbiodinium sp. CCMP2592]|nr:unnamed protein product [Symbiodinium sp. CCMP2592]
MIRFCTFWVLLFVLACCLLQQALRKTLQVSLVAPSLGEASERVEGSSSTERRDHGSAGSQASLVQGEVPGRARGARVSVPSCHGCRGGSLGDLSTLKATGPLRHVVVSMASREVDVLAFLVLARSLRAAGRFSGDIVLMWFGDPKTDISCRHKQAMEELHFRVVCVRQPLRETEIHSSVTGRSWDWVKLLAFTLTGFDLGVFLDVDMMAVRQIDELWSGLGAGGAQTQLAFVDGPKSLLNSGIFVFRPNMEDFTGLTNLVRRGQYSELDGWNHAGIVSGKSNHWDECQGLLYHYFVQLRRGGVQLSREVWGASPYALSGSAGIVHFTGNSKPCVLASMKKPGHTVNDESLQSYVQWYDYLSQTVDADTIASLSAGACERPVRAGSRPLRAPGNLATKSHWEDHAPLSPGSSVVVVTQAEYDGTVACSFVSESTEKSVFCAQEVAEHTLVKRWIPRDATVLEMGARYGTTSCAISQALGNSGKQVAVEPDERVWNAISQNRATHNCNFILHRGILGGGGYVLSGLQYGKRAHREKGISGIPHLTMAEAEQAYGLRFDTLLIDCEGCVNSFLKENHDALTNIRLILLEADQPKTIDYRKVIANLAKHGFEVVDKFQELDRPNKLWHYAFKRSQ